MLTIFQLTCFNMIICLTIFDIAKLSEVDLLNTATATSNLQGWKSVTYFDKDQANSSFQKWEELSFNQVNTTNRGYQICPDPRYVALQSKIRSWLRSPAILVENVSRVFVELKFWMRECHDLKNALCKETFKVYYHLANDLSMENSRLNDQYYKSIDTIAAEATFHPDNPHPPKINHEVVSFSLSDDIDQLRKFITGLISPYLHIAIVDEGACMALTSIRVFYKVCPSTVSHLARFPQTSTGPHDTSLITVAGKCVENSAIVWPHFVLNQTFPLYHCTSSGTWKIRSGMCLCQPGYEIDVPHLSCIKCSPNNYKSTVGNEKCVPCPSNSFTAAYGAISCQCSYQQSFYRYMNDTEECDMCARPPSTPLELHITSERHISYSVDLKWEAPSDNGQCNKILYCLLCQSYSQREKQIVDASGSTEELEFFNLPQNLSNRINRDFFTNSTANFNCKGLTYFPRKCQNHHTVVTIGQLRTKTIYKFTVVAINMVTQKYYAEFLKWSGDHRERAPTSGDDHRTNEVLERQLRELIASSSASLFYLSHSNPPPTVTDLHIMSCNDSAATISWSPVQDEDGKPVVTYQIQWEHLIDHGEVADLTFQDDIPSSTIVNGTSITLSSLTNGMHYQVVVRARNSAGYGNYSQPMPFKTLPVEVHPTPVSNPASVSAFSIYIIVIALAILVLVIVFVVACKKRSPSCVKTSSPISRVQPRIASDEEPDEDDTAADPHRTYVDPYHLRTMQPLFECETDPDHVTTLSVIGCGEFGEVYRGTLIKKDALNRGNDVIIDVAVKQLRAQCEPHEQLDFLREATALAKFRHPNIVALEAVVTKSRPFMIVTELMKHGCLSAFLKRHVEAGVAFPPLILVRMLKGVAMGMEYLTQLNHVHRDLAARNVLINEHLVCKVADFGLTRHLEENNGCLEDLEHVYTTQSGKIAIRWTAPEAVAYSSYSQASDIWSFGVLAWEVAAYGEKPYWNLTNQQVLQAINEGFRLPAPDDCPALLHQLMVECWHCDRHNRPTFSQVITKLDRMINSPDLLQQLASPASTGADCDENVESSRQSCESLPAQRCLDLDSTDSAKAFDQSSHSNEPVDSSTHLLPMTSVECGEAPRESDAMLDSSIEVLLTPKSVRFNRNSSS